MNKRILIISWHFPPAKSSTGFNFFKSLKDSGYTFDVLHMGENANSSGNMTIFSGAKSTFNLIGAANTDLSPFEQNGRKVFIEFCKTAARDLFKTNHYTAMVSQCAEFVSHIAAAAIKADKPELPWFTYYCDLQSGNPYQEYYNRTSDEEDNRLEKTLLELCEAVIVTNEFQKDLMLKNFSLPEDKFHIIPHCFDPRLLQEKSYANEKFVFSHIGMLYKHKRTSAPFIEAIKYLLQTWPEYRGKFQFKFIGSRDEDISDFIIADDGVHVTHIPAVSYEKSLQLMTEADALLLRDSDFSTEGLEASPFYPGKLVDYLATGKPIIAVTMRDGFTIECLRKHKNARWTTENNIAGLARYLKDAIDGKIEQPGYCINDTTFYNGVLFANVVEKYALKKHLLIAGYNFNEIKPLIGCLRNNYDYEVNLDYWLKNDITAQGSRELLNKTDTIICKDSLSIAAWYARNRKQGQKLIVIISAQQIDQDEIDNLVMENTDYFITCNPHSYENAIKKLGLPLFKTRMIPYPIEIEDKDTETICQSTETREKNIGIIDYVLPEQRLDLALDLFDKLWRFDNSWKLHLKGKSFTELTNQSDNEYDMDYYLKIRSKLASLACKDNIFFEDANYKKQEFLKRMGYLLSLKDKDTDTISMEQAMAAGCIPLLMERDRHNTLFPQAFVFRNTKELENFILKEGAWQNREKLKEYALDTFSIDAIAPEFVNLF